jgi:hypothetical protein
MLTIHLTQSDLDPGADALEGTYLFAPHYDRTIRETATVLKPDGTLLFTYVSGALSRDLCEAVFRAFRPVRFSSSNRGAAAGGQFTPVKRDGTLSHTRQSRPVPSGVGGFLDRDARNGPCRMSEFTLDHYSKHRAARPLLAAVNQRFRALAPDRWNAQRAFVERVSPDFVLPGTVFTTYTINKSWRTAAHRDDGDYAPGLGVMLAIEGRPYYGGELIFPKFRTAVDLRTGGLLLGDVHELHGNAPMVAVAGRRFERLSFVCYARERMVRCRSAAEELDRAQLDADASLAS